MTRITRIGDVLNGGQVERKPIDVLIDEAVAAAIGKRDGRTNRALRQGFGMAGIVPTKTTS